MTEDNSDLVKDWHNFAMMDAQTAQHIFDTMNPKPIEITCSLSQQSAEKMLKGFLVSNNINPPRTHDLVRLRRMCLDINYDFEELREVCEILNPYGSQPRYPNEIEISETDAEMALQSIQKMITFFENQGIGPRKPSKLTLSCEKEEINECINKKEEYNDNDEKEG